MQNLFQKLRKAKNKKGIKKMFRNKILAFLGYVLVKIFSFTHRLRFENSEIFSDIKSKKQNVIFAFWHGRNFVLLNTHRNRGIVIMASLSKDGDLQSRLLHWFGFKTVRGSSSRRGDRALLELIKIMQKGNDVALAIDGPRGPRGHAKPGVLYLAQKTGNPIIPVAASAKSFWKLDTWDQFLIPKPFTKTVIRYCPPIYVKPDDKIEDMLEKLDNSLNQTIGELDRSFEAEK